MANQKTMNFFIMTFLFVALVSCAVKKSLKEDDAMPEKRYKIPKDCDFNNILNGDTHSNECTPTLDNKFFSEFSGLLINAPESVIWPKGEDPIFYPAGPSGTTEGPLRLMVAGLARIQYKTLGLKGEAGEHVLVVAVNQKTGKTYSGKMPHPRVDEDPYFDINTEESPMTEKDKNALLNSYFNLNLIHDLEVPIENASYTVYATLGELKSNAVTIKTKVK